MAVSDTGALVSARGMAERARLRGRLGVADTGRMNGFSSSSSDISST